MLQDRWYQNEAVDSVGPYFTGAKVGNPLIGLPTGTGKAIVNARINYNALSYFPHMRGLNLTHVKELVDQNTKKMLKLWPQAPVGILSAGLKSKDCHNPIIFAGVQTAVNYIGALGRRDYAIVDEAHLVSDNDEAMYNEIFAWMRKQNPNFFVVGLSATLYRARMGCLTEGSLFTDIAYDLTDIGGFNRLLEEGFLCPLVPRPTHTHFSTEGLTTAQGDFTSSSQEAKFDKAEITSACIDEILEMAHDRHCWMIFASGTKHSDHIAEELNARGIPSASVHSKHKGSHNDNAINDFKLGKIRCLVNYGKLTTGFDHEPIDFIAVMRVTKSTNLWVQMLGRGTRPYDGRLARQYIQGFEYIKFNCLVADFGRNSERLGPINDPVLPRKPGEKGGDAPIKICPKCNTYNHASARYCSFCQHEFPMGGSQLMTKASGIELIKTGGADLMDIQTLDVKHVFYSLAQYGNSPPMMKVQYICGVKKVDDMVCLEHGTGAAHFAREWWKLRYGQVPTSTAEGLAIAKAGMLPTPRRIRVWMNKKPYPQVMGYEY
jgi:DNA repair protein RadD